MAGRYADRTEAGRVLAEELDRRVGELTAPLVLALPRGGVPVATEVAGGLAASLDVLMVRKLGAPGHRELAMGAVAAVGTVLTLVREERVLAGAGVQSEEFERVRAAESAVLAERVRRYRPWVGAAELADREVVVVDDGIATGSSMRAAVQAVRGAGARTVVVAAPVGAPSALDQLGSVADVVVCPLRPPAFRAVGDAYADFREVPDEVVLGLLAQFRPPEPDAPT